MPNETDFATGTLDVRNLPVWLYMPADGVSFDYASYVNLPAIGATADIISFTVPDGFNGVIQRIANTYVGAGFVEGSGSVIWQILANGGVVRNYDNMVASLGSVSNPSQISGILIKEGQLIELAVSNISVIVAGQLVGGRLGGFFYSTALEPQDVWL